jgi:hypothetical protein
MDRLHKQIGEIFFEWDVTAAGQAAMVGLGKLAYATLGASTLVSGLNCTPTSPASLQVEVGLGEIYQAVALEATPMDTLPEDSSDQLVKQGINLGATYLNCPPPATTGQSINYLIEAQYQDQDVSIDPTTGNQNVVLPFYNPANPTTPFSGPNNSGQSSNTIRKGVVVLQAKAGAAATTGSQNTPSVDAGWVGLWVVTVANGQSTITSGNIAEAVGAPFITEKLTQKISQTTGDTRYLQITNYQAGAPIYTGAAAGGPNAWTAALSPTPASLVDGMQICVDFSATNTSAGPTLNLNGLGALTVTEADGATALPIGLLPLNAILRYRSSGGGVWALISAAPITTGVISFNTRTGAVNLTSGDVTTALSYTPLDAGGSVQATGKITFAQGSTTTASVNIPQMSSTTAPTSLANGDLWTNSSGVFARINSTTIQLASATGAVTSFNTRTGAVTLALADVTGVLSGQSLSGKLSFPASSSGGAGVNFGQGAAPTSPSNGDVWITSSGVFAQFGGATNPLLIGPSSTTAGDFAAWNSTTGSALKDVAAASASQIWTGTDNGSPVTSLGLANASLEDALGDASTVNWNMDNGFNANLLMTSAVGATRTFAAPTNSILGRTYFCRFIQPASGGPCSVNFASCFDFGSAGAPVFNTAANKRDAVSFYCESTSPLSFVSTFFKG